MMALAMSATTVPLCAIRSSWMQMETRLVMSAMLSLAAGVVWGWRVSRGAELVARDQCPEVWVTAVC